MAQTLLCPDYVAWTMRDGNVMCGKVRDKMYGTVYIVRVDGSQCSIDESRLHPASCDEVEAACRFFATIGK